MSRPRMIVGGALLLAALLAACGGGDAATAEELESYFRGVESAKARHDEALPPSLFAAASRDELIEGLRLESGLLAGFAGDLRALDVPSSLTDDHDLLIGLSEDRVALQEEIALGLIGGADVSPYVPLREAGLIGWQQAACTLQRRAAAADVTIELGCDPVDLLETRAVDRRHAPLVTSADACRLAETPNEEADQQIATIVHFFNLTDSTIQVHRYTVAGQRELVATVEPRGDSLHLTYVGIGWIVTNGAGKCLGAAFPVGAAGMSVTISFD